MRNVTPVACGFTIKTEAFHSAMRADVGWADRTSARGRTISGRTFGRSVIMQSWATLNMMTRPPRSMPIRPENNLRSRKTRAVLLLAPPFPSQPKCPCGRPLEQTSHARPFLRSCRILADYLADELPSTVKSLNDGWLSVCQTAAAAVCCTPDFHKNPVHYTHPHTRAARQALLAFSYCALVFSCSATISSLVLTDEFGELPVRASRKSDPIKQGLFDSSSASLLEVYGARRSWRWVMWHCTLHIPRYD
ncbi:hypothetical protein EDB85DRAFT_2006555 [Lactarius pseudohatsudake]|nr:hypothetical protein EDB85DRAFT_2006555 [Lactarius pseudohatsudake]